MFLFFFFAYVFKFKVFVSHFISYFDGKEGSVGENGLPVD